MKIPPDLHLAFDIGYSSLGWAVIKSDDATKLELLGCGAVVFPPDDCLASKRRRYRSMRRHIRATRQRIERMGRALLALNVEIPEHRFKEEKPRKGDRRPAPWLLAARVLAARTEDEKKKARLSWSDLWDVLRWYAHNRGYDAHLRFSPDGKALAFAEHSALHDADFDDAVEQAEGVESADEDEAVKDSDKLRAGKRLSDDYGTKTFAETVARFLLGPPRAVKIGQPGKTGTPAPLVAPQSEDEFRKLLFDTPAPHDMHPRHLANYYKGIRAAFPRRVLRDGVLHGGIEWEVRRILRFHFNVLAKCDATLESALCGGLPPDRNDWQSLRDAAPALYVSDEERNKLRDMRGSDKRKERRRFLEKKLVLPKRYEGGLLFGQLGMRYHNRIIATCRFSYARIIRAFREGDDTALKPYGVTCKRIKASRRTIKKRVETDSELAHRWASKLAKVPARKSREFLLYRWSMRLADLTVIDTRPLTPAECVAIAAKLARQGSSKKNDLEKAIRDATHLEPAEFDRVFRRLPSPDDLCEIGVKFGESRNLTPKERVEVDQVMMSRGWMSKDELADLLCKVSEWEPANLKQTFDATPEAADSLCIDPLGRYLATHALARRVAALLNDAERKRLSRMLENGRPTPVRVVEKWLEHDASRQALLLREIEEYVAEENAKAKAKEKPPEEDEGEAPEKLARKKELTVSGVRRSALRAPIPTGRATFHRVILRQAREEILRGEDPRKAKRDLENKDGEDKAAHGCIFQTPELTRALIAGAKTDAERVDDFTRWRERWLSHARNRKRHARLETESAGAGDAWLRNEWQTAQTQGWLARQTNNHLVRHRLLVLDRLTRDIIADKQYGNGQPERVGTIAIEVSRDILTFSGLTRKQLAGKVLPSLKKHHEHVENYLKTSLAGTQWAHQIDGGLIWKAKVADDLGWRCAFTGQPFCPCDLASGKMDLEHIIPKSRRLTGAMEAVVITYKAINAIKGDRTAFQFIKEFGGNTLDGIPHPIRPLYDYEAWLKDKEYSVRLLLSGETAYSGKQKWPRYLPGGAATRKFHPDFKRRKARRSYLLIETYDKDKARFTPRDLTITSHLCRLAQQVLLRALPDVRDDKVTALPGSVTGMMRGGWGLLRCLDGAATEDVMRPKLDANGKPELRGDGKPKSIPKPKGDIRKLTHLHHALDASVIGLVSLVLPKDGKTWELIAKRELTSADVWAWDHAKWRSLIGGKLPEGAKASDDDRVTLFSKLDDIFRIEPNIDDAGQRPKHDHQWRLALNRLDAVVPRFGTVLRERLKEQRIIEQMPADYSGLSSKETVWRIFDPADNHPSALRLERWLTEKNVSIPRPDDTTVILIRRVRKDAEEEKEKNAKVLRDVGPLWQWIFVEVEKSKVLGSADGKLRAQKGGKLIDDNFGLALFPGAQKGKRFYPIRFFNVSAELARLGAQTKGHSFPQILRRGNLVTFERGKWAGRVCRVIGIREDGRVRFFEPDKVTRCDKPINHAEIQIGSLLRDGLRILRVPLCGIAPKPIMG